MGELLSWLDWLWGAAWKSLVFTALAGAAAVAAYAHADAMAGGPLGRALEGATGKMDWMARHPLLLPALIYINNLEVALLVVATALTVVLPFVVVAFNGLIVGYVVALHASSQGVVALLLPHGVVELPAIALASSLALDVPARRLGAYRSAPDLLKAVAGLLLAAALTEVLVTPLLALPQG